MELQWQTQAIKCNEDSVKTEHDIIRHVLLCTVTNSEKNDIMRHVLPCTVTK